MNERRFACTQCGKCCNRPPEVELGEASALADVFAWQLMFRLYSLPNSLAGYLTPADQREQASAEYFETRRLLGTFAAYSYRAKARVDGRLAERSFYLSISALALDLGAGSCSALRDSRCGIYPRRPLSCRTVPLHYSRGLAFAERDFDAFVAIPQHACDTGTSAPALFSNGQIAVPEIVEARVDAARQAEADRPWKQAIVKAMKRGTFGLPTLGQIEENAGRGVLTVPMRQAWFVALSAGLIDQAMFDHLIAAQLTLLDTLSGASGLSHQALQELAGLRRATAGAA